jgi:outer membrane lipoprotein carrier protein
MSIRTVQAGACAALLALTQTAAAEDGLARVQAYLDGLSTLSAHFTQTLLDPDGKVVESSSGTFELKRPGRFRWDYAPPHAQIVVADGERLWLYDPELEQVTVKTLDESLGNSPATLLSGQAKVSDGYALAREYQADGLDWVALKPRAEQGDFQELRLAFDGAALRGMELTDNLDQVTRIELSDVQRDVALPDARFEFVPPPGTDVVGAAPGGKQP